jgi:hypothetical protein
MGVIMLIKTTKNQYSLGRTRTEQCENLRKVYGGTGGMKDEDLDKLKHIERREGITDGFIPAAKIDELVR